MMLLSQVAQVLDGRLIGPDARFFAVSTDSRKIGGGDLFVALRGEHFDGHEFIATAIQAGAVAALVNADSHEAHPPTLRPESGIVVVEDTRLALGQLAAHWRAQFDIQLAAITGSNGKTTVKEMLAAILHQHTKNDSHDSSLSPREITSDLAGVGYQPSRMASSSIRVGVREHPAETAVLATRGNLNNDIGMPLTLLQLNSQHRYAVIEMGMNHPGEIDYLTQIASPDVALITNASSAHLAGLGSVEAVARAKGEIFAGLKPHGTAIINADDEYAPLWRSLAGSHPQLEFGLGDMTRCAQASGAEMPPPRLLPQPAAGSASNVSEADKQAGVRGQWQPHGEGLRLDVETSSGNFGVNLRVPGAHNARNALAAIAAAIVLDVPPEAIIVGLEKFGGVAGRLQRKAARHGATLIDDTYNANPASMRAAIGVLAQGSMEKPAGKRVLVMGDMGELGDGAAALHAGIGTEARSAGIERLLALGALSVNAVRAFGCGAEHFERIEDLQKALEDELDEETTVLVKGSRFMKMERVVQYLESGELGVGSGKTASDSPLPTSRFPGEKKCCSH